MLQKLSVMFRLRRCVLDLRKPFYWHSHFWNTIASSHNLKRSNLAYSFREFSPWSLGSKTERSRHKCIPQQIYLIHCSFELEQGKNAREHGVKDQKMTQGHTARTMHTHPKGCWANGLDRFQGQQSWYSTLIITIIFKILALSFYGFEIISNSFTFFFFFLVLHCSSVI